MILEYLKVILSVQMVVAVTVVLFIKVYKSEIKSLLERLVKLPGGIELSTPQLAKSSTEQPLEDKSSMEPQSSSVTPQNDQVETLTSLYKAERSRAYYWEYSYLNYYLAVNTQRVLDWIAAWTSPLSTDLFNTLWMPFVTDIKERQAIINALETHNLIEINNNLITITPKGREYLAWQWRKKPPTTT